MDGRWQGPDESAIRMINIESSRKDTDIMDRHYNPPLKNPPLKLIFAGIVLLFSGQVLGVETADTSIGPLVQKIHNVMASFRHSLELKNYPTALMEANQVVQLLEDGKHPKDHARAMHNLAKVQQVMGMRPESEKSYKQSIRIIEKHKGVYAAALLSPLRDLGSLYYNHSDYEFALNTLRRAQHITHRNDGVYSLEQLPFVDSITMLNIKTGQVKDADRQQRFYYSINVQNYGEDDPRMVPAMNKMADWYKASGQFKKALKTYEKVLLVIDKFKLGEIKKLRPLRGLSTVIYLKGGCCVDEPLGEALQIVMSDPGSDHVAELEALVHLADMQMIRNKKAAAKEYYEHAWASLGSENPLIHELFDTPELLGVSRVADVHKAYYMTVDGRANATKTVYRVGRYQESASGISFGKKKKKPATAVIGRPLSLCHSQALELARTNDSDKLAQYFVDVNFTVTSEGAVKNISLLDSNAPRRLQHYVTNTLRQARYRPSFREGKAVDTNDIRLRQTFTHDDPIETRKTLFNRSSIDGQRAVTFGCQILAATM